MPCMASVTMNSEAITKPSTNNDEVLLKKINVLLEAQHSDELLLVAMILLTRIEDSNSLQQTWNRYYTILQDFCSRIDTNNVQHLHVIARVVSRLERGSVSAQVYEVLYKTLSERVSHDAVLTQLDPDLILALNQSTISPESLLNTVWQRKEQVDNSMEIGNEQVRVVEAKDEALRNTDDKLVYDTLQGLLNQSEEDVQASFKEAIWILFISHGAAACHNASTLPTWYKPLILSILSSTELPATLGTQPHCLALQCSLELSQSCPKDLKTLLLNSTDLDKALIQLILLYISSSLSQQSDMQTLAWTTLAAMIQACGFDWIISSCSNGTLGEMTWFCTILRLATGEWRIQLDKASVNESTDDNQDDVTIANSCGQVICASLSYALGDETKMENNPAALLHMRDSLQDALYATVQFLCQCTQSASDEQSQATIRIAGRVLGSLLTEFNVWEGLPNGISTDETLQALSVALQNTSDNHGELLPSLVMVFGSIDDPPDECIASLDKHNLLEKTLVSYLVSYWKNVGEDMSHCLAACQVAELWYELKSPPSSMTLPLRKAIMQWIQSQVVACPSPNVSALSSAVDCYVMLFGEDAIPSEREATIVQQALEICESQQSS